MEYLQYKNMEIHSREDVEFVLNLVINGIPSIQKFYNLEVPFEKF